MRAHSPHVNYMVTTEVGRVSIFLHILSINGCVSLAFNLNEKVENLKFFHEAIKHLVLIVVELCWNRCKIVI